MITLQKKKKKDYYDDDDREVKVSYTGNLNDPQEIDVESIIIQ